MDKVKLPTVTLQGKQYIMVKDRLKYFREHFENHAIITDVKSSEGGALFTATIINKEDKVVSVAHSYGSLKGQKALEKLETVAVGRALAFYGIGIDDSVASADEMNDFINSVSE